MKRTYILTILLCAPCALNAGQVFSQIALAVSDLISGEPALPEQYKVQFRADFLQKGIVKAYIWRNYDVAQDAFVYGDLESIGDSTLELKKIDPAARTATVEFKLPLCAPREEIIPLALGDDGTRITEELPNANAVIQLSAVISTLKKK